MSRRLSGIGVSPGRARGRARWVEWTLPQLPHRTIAAQEVDAEVQRFELAREWARSQITTLRDQTEARVGPIEAKIFESQVLMLDDPDLVEGTHAYIRDNFLPAEKAFDWYLLGIRSQFLDTAHSMVLDHLVDLQDIRLRVLGHLLGYDSEDREMKADETEVYLLEELTPSFAVRQRKGEIRGLVVAGGSRSSHSAVLARSLGIPAVFGVGASLREIEDGTGLILDGGNGRIVVDPTKKEIEAYERAVARRTSWRERVGERPAGPLMTTDGVEIRFEANLDQPEEAMTAARMGAEGVGLFRSEFLVIGRRTIPTEDEQYTSYRTVLEAFPNHEVTLRIFDIGGDKHPAFLHTPREENPYLGWRGIRVCLDQPDLFRNQLRAALRASSHGRLRILIPFVVSVPEVTKTRELMAEAVRELGMDLKKRPLPLGIMVETPAALETLDLLAPHVDFLSLGTNDLTQYVVAADRGNPQLKEVYDPFHPALLRLYERLCKRALELGLDVSVCGDLAADPVGLATLVGLGYRRFSVMPVVIPELAEIVKVISAEDLERVCGKLAKLETAGEIRAQVARYLEDAVPFKTVVTAPV